MCWGRQATTFNPHPPLSLSLSYCLSFAQPHCKHTHQMYTDTLKKYTCVWSCRCNVVQSVVCVWHTVTQVISTNFTCLQLNMQNILASHLSMAGYNIPSAPLWARQAWSAQPIHTTAHTHTSRHLHINTSTYHPPCLCREGKMEGTKE